MTPPRASTHYRAALVRSLGLVRDAAPRELKAVVALQAVGAACLVVQLLVLRRVLDVLITQAGQGRAGRLVTELTALAIATAVGALSLGLAAERQRFMVELVRRHAMARILAVTTAVDLADFETAAFHDRLSRARQQALVRPTQVVSALLGLMQSLLACAALFIAMAKVAPIMLPIVAIGVIPTLLLLRRNSRDLHGVDRSLTTTDRERWYLEEVLSSRAGAKETRTFRLAPFLGGLQSDLADRRVEAYRSLLRRRSWRVGLASVLSSLVVISGLAVLAVLVLRGSLSPASAATAAVVAAQLGATLRAAGGAAGQVYENNLFLSEVESFFAMQPAPRSEPAAGQSAVASAGISVRNLTFTYPGTERPVLREISMEIPAGHVIAVVGENGSGKTTLTKLLGGLYRPPPESLFWDGDEDASGIDPESWRRRFGAVYQDFVRYELSARLNIAVGRHEGHADLEAVRAAARLADADRFLSDQEQGYETLLSRAYAGGADLSIGQWQRLALARAFFSDAPVLILDEPTSALDPRVEQELLQRVQALRGTKTVVLISHRLSSVRFADRIFVLRHGSLEEAGTHEELLTRKGHYAELFELQAAAYRSGDPLRG